MITFTYYAIAVFVFLNILLILNILWIRFYNYSTQHKMTTLEKKFDSLIEKARESELNSGKIKRTIPPKDFPYFERYLRNNISSTQKDNVSAERSISRISGFSDHLCRRILKRRKYPQAIALRTLSYLRDKENIPIFRMVLKYESYYPCVYAAAIGLALCRDTQSLRLIAERIFKAEQPNRDQLLAIMYNFGRTAAPHIHHYLDEEFLPEEKATALVDLLGLYRYYPAKHTLERIAGKTKSSELLIHVIETLGFLGDENTMQLFLNLLKHGDFRIRLKAVRSLAFLGGENYTKQVKDMLEDDDEWVRTNAAEALMDYLPRGEELLEKLAESKSEKTGSTSKFVLVEKQYNRIRWRYKNEELVS